MNKYHPLSRRNLWRSLKFFGAALLVLLPLTFVMQWTETREYVLAERLSLENPLLQGWLGLDSTDMATAVLAGTASFLVAIGYAGIAFLVSGTVDWISWLRLRNYLRRNLAHRREIRKFRKIWKARKNQKNSNLPG